VDVVTSDYQGTLYLAGTTTGTHSEMTASPSHTSANSYESVQKPWIRASGMKSWLILIDHVKYSKVLDLKYLDDTSQEWTADNINDEVVRSDVNTGNLCRLVAVIKYNPVYFNNADSQAKIMFIDKDG
jgi:hypothetical protein